MNAEIDAEAYEQRGESNRDQVEVADHGRGEARSPDKTGHQRKKSSRNQPKRTQPDEKEDNEQEEGADTGKRGAIEYAQQLPRRQGPAARKRCEKEKGESLRVGIG